MNEQFERIVATAKAQLDETIKKAQRAVDEAKIQMSNLARFAQDLPTLMLDKTNLIFVKDVKADPAWEKYGNWVRVNFAGHDVQIVDEGCREPLAGDLRIIVIVQKR